MGYNFDKAQDEYVENDVKAPDPKKFKPIIRHPSKDHELEKLPIDQLKKLAINCYFIIERPTERLAQIFKEAYNSLDRKLWIQCYKLARFEKMMELEK